LFLGKDGRNIGLAIVQKRQRYTYNISWKERKIEAKLINGVLKNLKHFVNPK
jgi:hypothetical protein